MRTGGKCTGEWKVGKLTERGFCVILQGLMAISISIKDTHAAISALQERGASKELAEGIVATVKGAELSHDPATQADIFRVENQISALRAEFYRSILIHGFVTVASVLGAAAILANVLSPSAA